MNSMKNKEKGVTGFFEEIFLFAVVILIFLSTLYTVVYFGSLRAEREKYIELYENVDKFAQSFLGYKKIIRSGTIGLFDYHKLRSITYENIKEDLQPIFNFSIKIVDVSEYPVKYNYTYGNETNASYAYYNIMVKYPANIWVSEEEIHVAMVEVRGWL